MVQLVMQTPYIRTFQLHNCTSVRGIKCVPGISVTGDCDCPRFYPLVGISRQTLIAVPCRCLLHVLRGFCCCRAQGVKRGKRMSISDDDEVFSPDK